VAAIARARLRRTASARRAQVVLGHHDILGTGVGGWIGRAWRRAIGVQVADELAELRA
jgi:hypothetical protein